MRAPCVLYMLAYMPSFELHGAASTIDRDMPTFTTIQRRETSFIDFYHTIPYHTISHHTTPYRGCCCRRRNRARRTFGSSFAIPYHGCTTVDATSGYVWTIPWVCYRRRNQWLRLALPYHTVAIPSCHTIPWVCYRRRNQWLCMFGS